MADDGNVTYLRPRNAAPPGLPPLPPTPSPTTSALPPATPPSSGAVSIPGSNRPSPAASLAAIPVTMPPTPGHVPATFRSGGLDDDEDAEEIGMGALGLAAVLAVALAALRGTAGAITDWRQRRMERATEAAPLRAARVKLAEARMRAEQAGLGSGGAGGRRVPSSQEYGRRTLNRGSGGGGGGGGGRSGGGSSGGHRSPSSGGTGPGRKHNGPGKGPGSGLHNGPSPKNGKGHGKGNGSGSGSGSGGSGTSGGGHGSGKKDRKDRGSNGSGKGGGTESGGRTPGTLGQLALERSRRRTERQRAADKRAERQQKADLKDKRRDGDDGPKKDGAKDRSSDKPVSLSKDKPERVTLTRAVAAETFRRAADRLKKRRERISPTIRRVPTEGDAAPDAATGTDDTSSSAPTPDETTATGPTEDTGTDSADTSAATDGTAATEAGEPGPAPGADAGYVSGEDFWEEPADADDFGPEAGEPWEPPGGGGRRNAWDSLFEAMWSAEVTWSVEQDGPATSHAPRWEPAALASAPESAAADTAAGTVTLIKEARVSAPIRLPSSAPAMAPEHATEVTLDQVVGFLDEVYGEAFATHDECLTLKVRARQLRDELEALAQELASTHNVVGRLTSTAMHKLSDSMDLAARKSEEMAVEALTAAESVERAKTDMDDAYRSIQQAAADAGLRTPSARVHNTD